MFTWTLDFRPQIGRMRVLLFTELPKLLGLLTQRILAPMHDFAGSVFGSVVASVSGRHRALPSATAVGVGRRTEWLSCRTALSFPGRYGRLVCVGVVTAASAASTAAVGAW